MKKIIKILACAVLSIGSAAAQTTKTYTGFVVDKNGNPVVGAEVAAPGGGATTITDSDGSFKIDVPFMLKKLTASYTGMRTRTLKLDKSSELVFNMKSLKKMTGFISVVGNLGISINNYSYNGYYNYSYDSYDEQYIDGTAGGGIMGGQLPQLAKWGWYVKCMGFAGFSGVGYGSLTAGAIRKLGTKFHLYFGAGAAYVYDDMGVSIDLGTLFTVSDHVNIIAGINYTRNFDTSDQYNLMNLNIGVGYTF